MNKNKKSKMFFTPKKEFLNIKKEKKPLSKSNNQVIIESQKNLLYDKNSIKQKNKNNKNSLFMRNAKNSCNVIFKRYELGNDIILPFKTINNSNESDWSNMPYYTFNNFNRIFQQSPTNCYSKDKILETNTVNKQKNSINKTYDEYKKFKSQKIINKNNNNGKKVFSFNKNNLTNNNKINKNILNLIELIDINNYLKTNFNNNYKTQRYSLDKIESFSQLRNKASSEKRLKKKNSTKYWLKKGKNNLKLNENHKNQEMRDKKEMSAYNKAKTLIDNPNSFIYLIYSKIKNQHFDEEGNIKKLDLKKRFSEYKKELNKIEQKARLELFNLKKQRVIGNEINKGRIISSNTFFNLAFSRGDF